MTRLFLGLPAPAKLNLCLHIVGRRADGYHLLQSVFVPLALADLLDFERRDDGAITRTGDLVGPLDGDLALRAARLLQQTSGSRFGADIRVDKRIPAGSGLGGGSSDAATTLLALNRLWALDWPRARLAELAVQLGADVPFFLGAGAALVEGIGERLSPLAVPPAFIALIHPQVHVSTAEVFADPGLTRNSKALIIADFSAGCQQFPDRLFGTNDLQAAVQRRAPQVGEAAAHLEQQLGILGAARMTGSGSAVFLATRSEELAHAAVSSLPAGWRGWVTRTLAEHPLAAW